MNKKSQLTILIIILAVIGGFVYLFSNNFKVVRLGGSNKTELIRLETPLPNQIISSPLTIKGEARGSWFFEASFPVVLTDWDGRIIAQGAAQAKSDWMTADFVPFEATITFVVDKNVYSHKGTLVLRKDNPSGLPANDDALEIPVVFAKDAGSPVLPFDSGVAGVVTLGPTCPVTRVGDTACADKPYATDIQAIAAGSPKSSPFATVRSNQEGIFKIMLPPGDYALQPVGGSVLPRCAAKNITIIPSTIIKTDLSCDTGIR